MTTPKTVDFCNKIKELYNLDTNYQLAKFTGWTQTTVGNYYNKGQCFSDTHAVKAAQVLDLAPEFVLNCIHAERAKIPVIRDAWANAAALLVTDKEKDYILCKIANTPKLSPFGQYPLDLQRLPDNVTRLETATFCRRVNPSKTLKINVR